MRPEKVEQLKKETQDDIQLNLLKETIISGWPDCKKTLNPLLMPYFDYADKLAVQDGIIFKGERVVINHSMRAETRKEIHGATLESMVA